MGWDGAIPKPVNDAADGRLINHFFCSGIFLNFIHRHRSILWIWTIIQKLRCLYSFYSGGSCIYFVASVMGHFTINPSLWVGCSYSVTVFRKLEIIYIRVLVHCVECVTACRPPTSAIAQCCSLLSWNGYWYSGVFFLLTGCYISYCFCLGFLCVPGVESPGQALSCSFFLVLVILSLWLCMIPPVCCVRCVHWLWDIDLIRRKSGRLELVYLS